MRALWDERPLGSVLEVIIDHRGKTPGKLGGSDFTTSGVPVVSAIHIKNGRIEWDQRERFVPRWMFEKWMPVRLCRGDVLLTSEAPLGAVAQVPNDDDLVLSQRLFALRGLNGELDSTFLRYFLQSPEGQRRLAARASGSTVSGIRQAELVKVALPMPGWEEQRRIAAALGALDDLIEANRVLGRQLTAIARTTYDRLVEPCSPKTPFSETVEVISGGTPKTTTPEYWDGGILWYSVADAPASDSPWVLSTTKTISPSGLANSPTRLLPENSTIISARGTVGTLALVGVPMAMNQSCYGLRSLVGSQGIFTYFSTQDIVDELRQGAHGSVFDTITRDSLSRVLIRLPAKSAVADFELTVTPLMGLARELAAENAELNRTRDQLLPLLMSGRVRVSEDFGVA